MASVTLPRVPAVVLVLAGLTGLLGLLGGCGPPGHTTPAVPGSVLHVANSGDGTVSRLDGTGGRVLERALPAGPAPWQVAPGPAGGLLVLSMDAAHVGVLTQLVPPAGRRGAWTVRPIPVGARTRQTLLAGDGEDYAAVAYSASAAAAGPAPAGDAAPPPCGLDLVDARAGRVVRRHAVCTPGAEAVTGLALQSGPGGPVVFLGIAGGAGPAPTDTGPGAGGLRGRSRLVALAADSGATLAVLPLAGPPAAVLVAAGPEHAGQRVYAVETGVGADPESPAAAPDRARLLALDPVTLSVEREHRLGFRPLRLAVAPEGDYGYALAGEGRRLLRIDLRTGAQDLFVELPARATDVAVTTTAVYVALPARDLVLMVPRRPGRAPAAIPVGHHPTGMAAAAPASS